MFGLHVTVMGGDCRFDVLGSYMYDVHQKLPEDARDVVIEDDVWTDSGAIIPKGATIGRGSIVGAGSVVTKAIALYSIVVGNPAKVIRKRFSADQIFDHEALLKKEEYVRV